MMFFSEYAESLVKKCNLHRDINGTRASMTVVFSSGVHTKLDYDLMDASRRAIMTSGTFATPLSRQDRERFMQLILNFNRDALSYLSAGLVLQAQSDTLFTFKWFVPSTQMSNNEWDTLVNHYEALALYAQQTVQKVMEEWTRYPH